jgi:PTS system nitrogen regulatory IIA component
MQVFDILTRERVVCGIKARSKKAILEALANLIASPASELVSAEVFNSLLSRERLGSTGLGHGVAIPHGRINHGSRTYGAFARTEEGIDFDALDNQPVDLFFSLLVPDKATDQHLQILAQLAEMFSDDEFLARLRASRSHDELFELLTTWTPRM